MTLNLKSFFGLKSKEKEYLLQDKGNAEYDNHSDFYLTNLINSLILFAISELEHEIDYAFTPVCFDTIFRNQLIDIRLKQELIDFKQETDTIQKEIWDWEFIDNNETWITVRKKANELLDKLGVNHREYNDDYVTVYDIKGNIIKKGEKL